MLSLSRSPATPKANPAESQAHQHPLCTRTHKIGALLLVDASFFLTSLLDHFFRPCASHFIRLFQMGRSPFCEKAHTNKGAWTKEEDDRLIAYIRAHDEGCWRSLSNAAGLLRYGKSSRLRWINYLRPDLKRGNFTEEEDELIIKLHNLLGNILLHPMFAGQKENRIREEIGREVLRNDTRPRLVLADVKLLFLEQATISTAAPKPTHCSCPPLPTTSTTAVKRLAGHEALLLPHCIRTSAANNLKRLLSND